MVPLEFANTVANSTEVQGAECKFAPQAFLKRLKWLNHYHHATPWEKLPQRHIWHGHFEFGQNLIKTKKRKGVKLQNYHTSIVRGAKCKINLTMLISSSRYPKNIYNMPLVEVGVEIKFEFEFEFKFELNQKRNGKRKRRKKKREGPDPLGLASGEGAHLSVPGPGEQSPRGRDE